MIATKSSQALIFMVITLLFLVYYYEKYVLSKMRKADIDIIIFAEGHLKIGIMTKSKLTKAFKEGEITQQQLNSYYQALRSFYLECATYAKKWFPLDDQLLKNAAFLDLGSKDEITMDQLIFFYNRLFLHMIIDLLL